MHTTGAVKLEQSGNRVGGPIDNLRESRRGQIDWSRIARARISRIDERPRASQELRARTGIDHRQQRARSAASGKIGQFARDPQVACRRPEIDEDVHYAAAGADLALVEIAGEIDFGQPRAAVIFFFK